MEEAEKKEKQEKVAKEILQLARNTLVVNLRFLDTALSRFEYFPIEDSTLLTDGRHLLYHAPYILKRFRTGWEVSVRDFLHVVLHRIFRHMYVSPAVNRVCWDLACDIAVESVISDLGLRCTTAEREEKQQDFFHAAREDLQQITAEKVYEYLMQAEISPLQAANLRGLFYADSHEIWYMSGKAAREKYGVQFGAGADSPEDSWKDISRQVQLELEAFGKQHGRFPGKLMQNLRAVNREKCDYTAFLKKFAVPGEIMKVNDNEFDYIYYTEGLQRYKNMPLIEPLEYRDVRRIREFVIAIDTSGSTSGELVQKFVQKTYNILKSTESFFSRINLHIIQCDAEIQEDTKITCQEDFDRYLKKMKIRGLGGTDFRPVFSYVDRLQKEKDFRNLSGLIYFTDGCGTFPRKMPGCRTAFVFLDEGDNSPEVPPWAIRLLLHKKEIELL